VADLPAPALDPAAEAKARAELARLMDGLDTAAFVARYCGSAISASSLPHCLSAARLTVLSAGAAGSAAAAQVFAARNGAFLVCLRGGGVSAKNVQIVHEFLEKELKNSEVAETFKQESLKLFPHMNYFGCGVEFKGLFDEQETC
jgi:hypothetical protein